MVSALALLLIGSVVMIYSELFSRQREKNDFKELTESVSTLETNELKECYIGILTEAYRLLKKNGLLIFKCQDYTDGKTTMTHCLVWMWAVKCGFYAKDIAILNLPIAKVYNGSLRQRHLRKSHCYYWIFTKGGCDKFTVAEILKGTDNI